MIVEIFWIFFCFVFKNKRGPSHSQPLGLGHNWPGPNHELINLVVACRNEFCMQQPRRGRKRQSKEEEVAWRGGLGRDEVVRPVAREATAEVMVAGRWSWRCLVVLVAQSGAGGRNGDGVGFLWRRKKEEEIEEENLQREEGGRLVFWLTLDPIFSSLRPSNQPLFIASGRG